MSFPPRKPIYPLLFAAIWATTLGLAPSACALPLLHSDYQSYLTGSSPYLVATGDLNGDGFDDAVVADADGVALFFARGDQTFAPAQRFEPTTSPGSLVMLKGKKHGADRLGLVLRRDPSAAVEVDVYERVGARNQSGPVVVTFAHTSDHVVAADVDGDGVCDLVASDGLSPQLWIAYGRHDGRFDAAITVNAAIASGRIAVGDVDGDGRLDLIATNGGSNVIAIVRSLGGRAFAAPIRNPVASAFDEIALGDFDGDGRADLALESPFFGDGEIRTYLGTAGGQFVLHDVKGGFLVASRFIAADLDGDGKADLVFGRGPDVLLRGAGAFADPARIAEGAVYVRDLASGDFDGDGRLDLAVVDGVGLGCGLAGKEPATGEAVSAGVTGSQVSLHAWHGHGDGTFESAPVYPSAGFRSSPLLVDLDADGLPDLVVGSFAGTTSGITTWRGRADGSFDAPVGIDLGDQVTAVAAGNFDGDGHTELAVNLGFHAGTVALLRLRPDRTLDQRADTPTGAFAHQMVVGDFDHDGRADLALSNLNGANVVVLLARPGFGAWQVSALPARVTSWAIATADFDGDGRMDLAIGSNPSFSERPCVRLFRGAGDGTFAFVDSLNVRYSPLSVRGVDADGDGRPDLVISVSTRFCFDNNTLVQVQPNAGQFRFGDPTTYFMEAGPRDATVADVTGDGVPDLLAVSGGGRVAVRPGLGGFQFGDLMRFGLPALSFGWLEVADLDHDGRQDVVVDDEAGVHVLRNQGATAVGRPRSTRVETSGASSAPGVARLAVVGNPVARGGPIAFELDLPRAVGTVDVRVYDVGGRALARLVHAALPAGTHHIPWPTAHATPGLYFARATLDGRVVTTRVLVLP